MLKKIMFDDFVRLGRGFDLPDDKIIEGNYPVVTSTNIKAYHNEYKIEPPVVVTGRSGSLGKVQYVNEKCWPLNTALYSKDFRDNNPRYVYYYLQTMHLEQYNAGAGVPTLNQNHLQRLKIKIHESNEQKKIADILSTYDDLIENNNKRIKILEQMAEELYKEWFVRFHFPGYEEVTLKEQTPSGWVLSSKAMNMVCPETWAYDDFSRIGSFIRGKNITSAEMIEGDIPVVSAGLEPSGYHNSSNVTGKSLTISASGANAGYLKYHLSDIWAADCSYFQDNKKLWFVYNALNFLQPVISNLQVGAAQPHVYPKNINKLCTIIPDDDTIQAYCDKVEPIYEEIKILKDKNQNLIKQRDLLLPRLMSGKLEV